MTYQQILENIFEALPMYHKVGSAAYKEGLENIEILSAIIGNPERKLKCIHVAGTNGKGSVTHLLSSFYQEAGKKVGLYTSPHLTDFRERIKINGEMISQEAVVAFFEKFENDFKKIEPSFFEMTTALAFYHFAKEEVDVAIIEVGLGGRLDATNVITPMASVITNISLEHTQLLGDTLAKIAFEKAGIMKPHTPVVIGRVQPETMPVYQQRSELLSAPIHTTEEIRIQTIDASHPSYRIIDISDKEHIIGKGIRLPLAGDYQIENIATFVRTVQLCASELDNLDELIVKAIRNVLVNTGFQGRWQIIDENPLTICDTGHNRGGFEFLSKQLNELKCTKLRVIIGFVNDKDIDSIIKLLPKNADYTVCRASVARAMEPEEIIQKMTSSGLTAKSSTLDVYQTYLAVKEETASTDAIFIGGSTFIVADFLSKK